VFSPSALSSLSSGSYDSVKIDVLDCNILGWLKLLRYLIKAEAKMIIYNTKKCIELNYRIKKGLVWFIINQQSIWSRIWSSFLDSIPHIFQFFEKKRLLIVLQWLKTRISTFILILKQIYETDNINQQCILYLSIFFYAICLIYI
jgi:hypothetical protein